MVRRAIPPRTRAGILRGRLRDAIGLVVLLSQITVATAFHRHAIGEGWLDEDAAAARQVHDIACRTPDQVHWHADRVVEVEPCLACLRQHLARVHVDPPAVVVAGIVRGLAPSPISSPRSGFLLGCPPRGPPSAA